MRLWIARSHARPREAWKAWIVAIAPSQDEARSFSFLSAVNSMRQIDNTNCILVQDIKAVTHENAHVHDSISTQIPTEGKYR
jgi:hypothetical protein